MTDDQKRLANYFRDDGAHAAGGHGRAALLLTESLIHALLDKGMLTHGEAIEIIDIATEVECELAAAADGGRPPQLHKSLLAPLANSLRGDLR